MVTPRADSVVKVEEPSGFLYYLRLRLTLNAVAHHGVKLFIGAHSCAGGEKVAASGGSWLVIPS